MSSIPLLALSVKPPEQYDPVGQYSRLLELRQQQQQSQMQQQEAPLRQQALQQQVQGGQLQLQQQQQQLKDQQAMTAAMHEWDGKSLDDLSPLVLKNGGSSTAVMGLKQKALEIKQTYSKIAADDATTGSKNIETQQKKNSMVSGALASLQQVPDEQLSQAITAKAQDLTTQGLLDPQHAQMAAQLAQSGDPAAIRKNLALFEKGYKTDNQLLDEAKATETARHNQADETNMAAYRGAELKQGAQRISIEGGRLALEQKKASLGMDGNLTGPDFLNTLSPGMQAQVKAAANGDIAIPPPGTRNPQAQAIRSAVLTYDPTYTDARYKGKQAFKGGADANSIMQLATAAQHLEDAQNNSKKVGFAPFLAQNATPTDAAYNQDVKLFANEAGKLVKNGVITEGEYNDLKDGMNSRRQGIRDAALAETANLVGGKIGGLFQKYKNATGQDLPVDQFFDAPTQQRLSRFGVTNGTTSSQPAPKQSGGTTTNYKIVNGQLVAQ